PGDNVRHRGSVLADGETPLPVGTLLPPARLMLAAAANRAQVRVARRPRGRRLATGDELVAPGSRLRPDPIVPPTNYGLAPLRAAFPLRRSCRRTALGGTSSAAGSSPPRAAPRPCRSARLTAAISGPSPMPTD